MTGRTLLLLAATALAACSPKSAEPTSLETTGPIRPDIAPADFALLPCSGASAQPCALLFAGGKRLLFGAPAGVSAALPADDLAQLDAAFLMSLRPEDVEGLDEVRNRSWRAGRPDTLGVTGPGGTESLLDGLNLAFEQSDALSFVEEGAPAGGFDAALLSLASEVGEETLVFDSGDLKVLAVSNGTGRTTYRIGYRDLGEAWHDLVLASCGGGEIAEGEWLADAGDRTRIGCTRTDADLAWPLSEPVFLEKAKP